MEIDISTTLFLLPRERAITGTDKLSSTPSKGRDDPAGEPAQQNMNCGQEQAHNTGPLVPMFCQITRSSAKKKQVVHGIFCAQTLPILLSVRKSKYTYGGPCTGLVGLGQGRAGQGRAVRVDC